MAFRRGVDVLRRNDRWTVGWEETERNREIFEEETEQGKHEKDAMRQSESECNIKWQQHDHVMLVSEAARDADTGSLATIPVLTLEKSI